MAGQIKENPTGIADILAGYPADRGSLIPILQDIQERFGYLPEKALEELEKLTGISLNEIYGVATFYAQFRFRPPGEHTIRVCQGTACHVRGGHQILVQFEQCLGTGAGETTPDGRFSLERVACIGACAISPALVVNEKVYGEMSPQKVKDLFTRLRPGASDAKE